MWCPYCGYDKPANQFTTEHVIPKALGGGLVPTNPFVLPVCRNCNAACGRWIDGPFVRSWLINLARAACGMEFCDPASDPVIPLILVGAMEAWKDTETVCDFWLGPFGDHIYHFHQNHPDAHVFAGKPPHVRDSDWDPGAVYIAFVTLKSEWHAIIYRSACATFKGASIHFINAAPTGVVAPYPPIPAKRLHHLTFIKSIPEGEERSHRNAMPVDLGERFLAKLALGFGTRFLSPDFERSVDAARLRKLLWERYQEKRGALEIAGTGFLMSNKDLVDLFGLAGCHTFALQPLGAKRLVLVAVFYGSHGAAIEVTTDPLLWADRVGDSGVVWLVAPGLRQYVGPLKIARFLTEKMSNQFTEEFLSFNEMLTKASRYQVPKT